ncbi:MAG: hypothetical protein WC248_01180 [Candidatus Methanomethylophilaceae archaeon]
MLTNRMDYLNRFLDCIDFVIAGKKGSISNDKWLVANYDPSFYSILSVQLKNTDTRVRTEIVLLLTALKERLAIDDIKSLRMNDNEKVSSACLAFFNEINETDDCIPDLIDELKHKRGQDFKRSAMRIKAIGRSQDVPTLRMIYGQTDNEMRAEIRDSLESIIDRDPELKKNKELLLSVPVFPDEKSFERFLETSTTYLDIRYRDSVCPLSEISLDKYNNIIHGIQKIRIRMFNEQENLKWYPPDMKGRYDELLDLVIWAVDDIKEKRVISRSNIPQVHDCKRCGSRMALSHDTWICSECGFKE